MNSKDRDRLSLFANGRRLKVFACVLPASSTTIIALAFDGGTIPVSDQTTV